MKTYCIECGTLIPGVKTKDGESICDSCRDRLDAEFREDAERRGESLTDDHHGKQGGIKGCIKEGFRLMFYLAVLFVIGSCIVSEVRSRMAEEAAERYDRWEQQQNKQNDGYERDYP